jgi:hypothetical protein
LDTHVSNAEAGVSAKHYSVRQGEGLKVLFKETAKPTPSGNRQGYRIINLDKLGIHVMTVTVHCMRCEAAQSLLTSGGLPIKFLGEVCRRGLASILSIVCLGCSQEFKVESSSKLNVRGSVRYDINFRAVWGQMTTGGGHAKLDEVMGTFGIPGIRESTFCQIEEEIGGWWHDTLQEEMKKAGEEEKRRAIERHDYHQGVPAITIVVDGGWCKRSHKHSYNALGGAAIVVGAETGKILDIRVRNKTQ